MVQIKLFSAVKNFKHQYKEITDEEFPAENPTAGENGINQLAGLIDTVLKQVVKEIKKQTNYRDVTKSNLQQAQQSLTEIKTTLIQETT